VRVSVRRRKTSEAKWVNGRIIVSLPAHLDHESRLKTTDWLVQRLLTRHGLSVADDDALLARAVELSERYLVGARPTSVRWVTNQTARWGSCSWYSGEIRISHRLRAVPEWVLDSVLVHELAHLSYPEHSPAFHRLAAGYPRHDEAGTRVGRLPLARAACLVHSGLHPAPTRTPSPSSAIVIPSLARQICSSAHGQISRASVNNVSSSSSV